MTKKEKKNIVWLASYPKSGNTWFRIFIAHLIYNNDSQTDINNLRSIPVASSRALFDKYTGISSSELSFNEIENLRPEVYRKISEEAKDTVFLKAHDYWHLTPSGQALFPADITKGVIYFIRNPLDVAISFSHHLGIGIDACIKKMQNEESALCYKSERLYHQFKQELSDWSGHISSWVDQSGLPVHTLKYEDMHANTYSYFKEALDFIGLEAKPEHIKSTIEKCSFSKLAELEESTGFTERPLSMKKFFRSGTIGNWQTELTKKQIELLKKRHSEMMVRFGYIQ